jgi:3-oxoacyl-[acyl-carrier protein] reductase
MRVAAVTGAGRGIGFAIARMLVRQGTAVVVNDVDGRAAHDAARRLTNTVVVVGDVATEAGARAVVEAAVSEFGGLDVLVANAGFGMMGIEVGDVTAEDWSRVIEGNLTSQFYCVRFAVPVMRRRGGGRIVGISSRAWLGQAGGTPYAAAKGGVVSLMRSLALELAPYGITANSVVPGSIATPALEAMGVGARDALLRAHPMGRFGDPDDVARAVCFLAHPAARRITGQTLYVTGGRNLLLSPGRP